METHNVYGYSSKKELDTPKVPGYSRPKVLDTPNVPGYSRQEVLDTPNVPGYSSREVLEGQCEDTDPGKMTAEGSRHTSDASQQPSASGDQTSIMMQMFEMMKEIHSKIIAHPGRVIQTQHQDKEENEVLKREIKKLEARNKELLSKVMDLHQNSEDLTDPSRLSAVLERYELLQQREWEKVRSSIFYPWTYEQGSDIIKKLFNACEKSIQQRTDDIFNVLDIHLNDAMTKSKQEMMREIRKLFRQPYYQNHSFVYEKIVREAAIPTKTENQKRFLLQCCQIYCLLLLQDPPVKAEWNMDRRYLEHVDKKDAAHWKKPTLLWPIMKRGEEIIVKGVVWD